MLIMAKQTRSRFVCRVAASSNNDELLIKTYGRNYPVRIYDTSRVTIGYRQKQAQEVLAKAMQE